MSEWKKVTCREERKEGKDITDLQISVSLNKKKIKFLLILVCLPLIAQPLFFTSYETILNMPVMSCISIFFSKNSSLINNYFSSIFVLHYSTETFNPSLNCNNLEHFSQP